MTENLKQKLLSKSGFILYLVISILLVRFVLFDNMLSTITHALGQVILALILIYLLNPLVSYLEKKLKISRSFSVAISYLLMVISIIALIIIISPAVINSFKSLISTIPDYNVTINNLISELDLEKFNISTDLLKSLINSLNDIIYNISQSILTVVEHAIISARVLLTVIVNWIIALLITWYGLKEYPNMGKTVQKYISILFKPSTARKIIHIMELSDTAFRSFIVGKVVTCAILGAMVYVAMLIFNIVTSYTIPYLPLIAIIIGITNMIPYFGPLLGAIPCVLMALFNGVAEGIAVIAIIMAMQQIDNLIVGPKVLGSYVGISPFWTIVFISVGGALNGALGMIIAVPIGTVLIALWEEFIAKRAQNKQLNKAVEAAEK